MTESSKTSDKCPRCKVTNPISFKKCRQCGAELPWANGAPVSADPLAATSSTQSATGAPANAAFGGASAATSAATSANCPPQIASGRRGPIDEPVAKPRNMAPFYASGVVAALVAFFLVTRLLTPRPVEAITAFEAHTTKGQTFQSLAPTDAAWELHEGAREDGLSGGSRWENGSAQINIAADAAGSMMSEGSKLSPKSPQQTLHEMEVRQLSEKYGNYEEEPSQKTMGAFGETWLCEFSGRGGFRVGKLHGLRATMLSNQNRIQFIATCRDSDWEKLKPSFYKILASLSPLGSPVLSAVQNLPDSTIANAVPGAAAGAAPNTSPNAGATPELPSSP